MRDRQTQKNRSVEFNFDRFFVARRRTLIWWRKAKFSSWSSARGRTIDQKAANNAAGGIGIEDDFGKEV
jgi:hypothetical protein